MSEIISKSRDVIGVKNRILTELMNQNNKSSTIKLSAEDEEHRTNKNNPHNVTKEQLGLGNVDNTSDMDKPIVFFCDIHLNTTMAAILIRNLAI